AAPSRDMLIRRVAPKGATGTIYGLVYSGMDVGASMGPAVFGYLVDAQIERGPWYGAALAFVVSALLAVYVAHAAQQQQRRVQPESASLKRDDMYGAFWFAPCILYALLCGTYCTCSTRCPRCTLWRGRTFSLLSGCAYRNRGSVFCAAPRVNIQAPTACV